ncbi:MAG: phage tail protein [Deltaproteobacteria bacterium]|nr:phage tail protein [Deltaproteobacteria bacterium]MBW2421713.1 phage tail protein [Deltaproteobacteria bacterium]
MSEPFVGEIRMFAGNFAPRGWAYCDGQLLAVSQNDALFSLFGTIYGGDGRTTFGLPDMRGRVPIHFGNGPGLSSRNIGSKGGSEKVTVTTNQLPSHTHTWSASSDPAEDTDPATHTTATPTSSNIYGSGTPIAMSSEGTTSTGGGGSHDNMMPTLCVHFIVALFGVYPSRQ